MVVDEYVVYDFNSFVADVGGFTGLLLGHSLLSIYKTVASWSFVAGLFARSIPGLNRIFNRLILICLSGYFVSRVFVSTVRHGTLNSSFCYFVYNFANFFLIMLKRLAYGPVGTSVEPVDGGFVEFPTMVFCRTWNGAKNTISVQDTDLASMPPPLSPKATFDQLQFSIRDKNNKYVTNLNY